MGPRRSRLAWLAVAALAASGLVLARSPWTPAAPSASVRLIAPLLPLVASVQWIRLERAMHAGRPDLALARADTLFELQPRSPDAHVFVSLYLAFQLASPEREPDPARRAEWLRAALAVVRRGEASVDEPAELAWWQGELLAHAAEVDTELAWPGGARGLWREAAAHFERAARLGHSTAGARAAFATQCALEDPTSR